jgi:hypothetical protein
VSTVRVVARRDLGRRWRRLLVVILLVGFVGGFTLAMAAGARRTSSALDRFKSGRRSADVELAAAPTAGQLEELSHAPDRRQLQATVAWQATTLGLVGLLVGIPAGVVLGALTWRIVAGGLGVAAESTIPLLALAMTAVVALVLVNVIAFLPARAAASCRAAVALRAE